MRVLASGMDNVMLPLDAAWLVASSETACSGQINRSVDPPFVKSCMHCTCSRCTCSPLAAISPALY